MESPNQEKITGRLCAFGRAEYTNLIGGAGYKFIENGGFKWELDPVDLDRYGITMDALLDCVDQLEKMGTVEQLKDKEHFKSGDGYRNAGIVIQSKLDPRIACSVELIGNEYDKSDVTMRWFVDVEKESKSAVGAPERMVDPEELKAVERAQEMNKEPKSDKKESIDELFELPIRSAAPTGVKAINEGLDGWGLPTLGEAEGDVQLKHVGDDNIGDTAKKVPGKEYDEKEANKNIEKTVEIGKDVKHVEGDGPSDPTLELGLPQNKIKPGDITKEPALNHMEEAKKLEEAGKAAEKKFVELMKKKKAGDKSLKGKTAKEIKKMAGLKEDADMSHTGYEREEGKSAHKHPKDRKKSGEGLDSDNDGHMVQETGEPDQDYEKEELDKIVAALKDEGYEGSHREFDKYQGVHLDVEKDDVSQRFWVRDVDEMKDGGCIIGLQPEEGGEEAELISVMVDEEGAHIGDLVDFLGKGGGGDDGGKKEEPKEPKEEPKEESVLISKGTDENKSAVGVHLIGSKGLKEAKEFAAKAGIANIYVHRQAPKFGEKIESRSYISKDAKMLQVEDNDVYVGVKALEAPKEKADDGKNREEVDGEGKVKVKADDAANKSPEHVDGGGQSQVGGTDKETAAPAGDVKPGKPDAAPKLMAERKKLREAAMKRREERIAESKKKSKLGESKKELSPGHKRLIGEGYDHPHKVVENLKRHMDEAHRAARKAHDAAEHAHKKMSECMESMPHPMASEMKNHDANMHNAKAKLHEGKRMISDVCESVDRLHRGMKRK